MPVSHEGGDARSVVSVVLSPAPLGLEAETVRVEVDLRPGLPAFSMVGLPDAAVQEARERVRSGIANQAYAIPAQRVVVNLAPGSLRKAGPQYDLPVALGVLAASGQMAPAALAGAAAAGELALDGSLRPVAGTLAMAEHARGSGLGRLVVSEDAAGEAALVPGVVVLAARSLRHAVDLLEGRAPPAAVRPAGARRAEPVDRLDLADVRGQPAARRALEVAAAGGHSLLMMGPPGGGKTMLARRLPGILPAPTPDEALEITRVHSAAGLHAVAGGALAATRPFRAPHHSASVAALVGGGPGLRPGEVSLAHRGVLFLDEVTAFAPSALDALRTPLQDGAVTVARAQRSVRYPAGALLVAAGNPCPCGFAGDPERACSCSESRLAAYRARLSGPLLDRVALTVDVPRVDPARLSAPRTAGETSATVRERVRCARERASGRARRGPTGAARRRLEDGARRAALTARGCVQVASVAQTIADLDGAERIGEEHVAEALTYQRVGPYG